MLVYACSALMSRGSVKKVMRRFSTAIGLTQHFWSWLILAQIELHGAVLYWSYQIEGFKPSAWWNAHSLGNPHVTKGVYPWVLILMQDNSAIEGILVFSVHVVLIEPSMQLGTPGPISNASLLINSDTSSAGNNRLDFSTTEHLISDDSIASVYFTQARLIKEYIICCKCRICIVHSCILSSFFLSCLNWCHFIIIVQPYS